MQRISRRQFLRDAGRAALGIALAEYVPGVPYASGISEQDLPDKCIFVQLYGKSRNPGLRFIDKEGMIVRETFRNPKFPGPKYVYDDKGYEYEAEPVPEFIEKEREVNEIVYPVIIGTRKYPTPRGEFEIAEIRLKPDWLPPKKENGDYVEWVRPEHRKIADENGGMIPYGHKQNPLGEFKVKLRDVKTGEIREEMIHGNGDYYIENGIWIDSHGCIRMKNDQGLGLLPFLYEGFPVIIDELYPRISL
jgi:hypothetical protein